LESYYPNTGVQGTCKYNANENGAYMANYRFGQAGSESALLTMAVAGPVAVAIDASLSTFTYYSSGIYSDPSCSAELLDHAVTVVGWGEDYWLVKNSWGTCTPHHPHMQSPP